MNAILVLMTDMSSAFTPTFGERNASDLSVVDKCSLDETALGREVLGDSGGASFCIEGAVSSLLAVHVVKMEALEGAFVVDVE